MQSSLYAKIFVKEFFFRLLFDFYCNTGFWNTAQFLTIIFQLHNFFGHWGAQFKICCFDRKNKEDHLFSQWKLSEIIKLIKSWIYRFMLNLLLSLLFSISGYLCCMFWGVVLLRICVRTNRTWYQCECLVYSDFANFRGNLQHFAFLR